MMYAFAAIGALLLFALGFFIGWATAAGKAMTDMTKVVHSDQRTIRGLTRKLLNDEEMFNDVG